MAQASHLRQRRSRPLRVECDQHPFFVTSRVIEERFWLHPILTCGVEPPNRHGKRLCDRLRRHADRRLERLVKRANARSGPRGAILTLEVARRIVRSCAGAALARAQERYGVTIYAFVVMSNHIHLLCQTTRRNLAGFVGYLKARITTDINLLTGKRGPLWARRYDAQPVLDDAACADRAGYTVGNPSQAGLVDDAEHWPGLNLAYGLTESHELTFEYFDRTAWHRKKRPVDLRPFMRTATLVLSPIPSCDGMDPDTYRDSLQSWVAHSLAKARARKADEEPRRSQGRKAVGIDAVIEASFESRPRAPSFRRRPYAHGAPDAVRVHSQAMLALQSHYAAIAERYRGGQWNVEFPEGTYRPPLMQAA